MTLGSEVIDKITTLAKRYGATRLILFGTAADPACAFRDLDLACDGIEGWRLYEFAARVEDETGLSVDIVPLKPASMFVEKLVRKGRVLL